MGRRRLFIAWGQSSCDASLQGLSLRLGGGRRPNGDDPGNVEPATLIGYRSGRSLSTVHGLDSRKVDRRCTLVLRESLARAVAPHDSHAPQGLAIAQETAKLRMVVPTGSSPDLEAIHRLWDRADPPMHTCLRHRTAPVPDERSCVIRALCDTAGVNAYLPGVDEDERLEAINQLPK